MSVESGTGYVESAERPSQVFNHGQSEPQSNMYFRAWKLQLLLLLSIIIDETHSVSYIAAFSTRQGTGYWAWPTPSSPRSDISSTFGPRAKSSCGGCYDFHRGIDIHGTVGDNIVAIAPGVVDGLRNFTNGGLTVVLRHDFAEPVNLAPNQSTFQTWYSYYMHMSEWAVAEDTAVEAGEVLGLVGLTGATVSPHLHLEIRVGTKCSLEFALNNGNSTCNTLGIDPHVHPLLALESEVSSVVSSIAQPLNSTSSQDAIVRVETDDINANVNSYLIEVTGLDGVRLSHLLDLNRRVGFDASSVASIDTQDTSVPYLEPASFGYTSSTWAIDLILPHAWVGELAPDETVELTVTDIWGNSQSVTIRENEQEGETEEEIDNGDVDCVEGATCSFGFLCGLICNSFLSFIFRLFGFQCESSC